MNTFASRKPVQLIIAAVLCACCTAGLYLALEATARQKPVLPPLAAQRNLELWLDQHQAQLPLSEPLYHAQTVSRIYQQVGHQTLWLDDYQLSSAGQQLLQQLRETSADEILDYRYHLTYIQQRLHNLSSTPKDVTAIDLLLTDAFISYAEDVLGDNLLPEQLYLNYRKPGSATPVSQTQSNTPDHSDIVKLIHDNQAPWQLHDVLESMAPPHPAYSQLRQAMERYRKLLASEEWQPLAAGPTLKPGMKHAQVVPLRNLLRLLGDYPPHNDNRNFWGLLPVSEPELEHELLFDDTLKQAVERFQYRHGKTIDGAVGPETRRLLNIHPSYRIKQIALNMKRWRQLPKDLGDRYIWVNLTDYRLQLIREQSVEMEMKVIIGKRYRRTPVMWESIRSLVLNPTWNVPYRIARYDILPQIKKNPNYLKDRNIKVIKSWQDSTVLDPDSIDWSQYNARNFPYRFQQDAGNTNALGTIKFVIPNDDAIYLHDTSHPELFSKEDRALSSGCVRVEHPLALANALMQGNKHWDHQRIANTLEKGKTTYVKLPEAIPTYLLYWTTWVDQHGILQFRDDIYQRDSFNFAEYSDADQLIL